MQRLAPIVILQVAVVTLLTVVQRSVAAGRQATIVRAAIVIHVVTVVTRLTRLSAAVPADGEQALDGALVRIEGVAVAKNVNECETWF